MEPLQRARQEEMSVYLGESLEVSLDFFVLIILHEHPLIEETWYQLVHHQG